MEFRIRIFPEHAERVLEHLLSIVSYGVFSSCANFRESSHRKNWEDCENFDENGDECRSRDVLLQMQTKNDALVSFGCDGETSNA